jgi:hypothetical protein
MSQQKLNLLEFTTGLMARNPASLQASVPVNDECGIHNRTGTESQLKSPPAGVKLIRLGAFPRRSLPGSSRFTFNKIAQLGIDAEMLSNGDSWTADPRLAQTKGVALCLQVSMP